jgi:DNA-binding LacI/PurR family transcriptional regulator
MSKPPLTSVDIHIFELGYQASRSLIQLIEDRTEPTKRIIIPHQLVERQSCSHHLEKQKADSNENL